MIDTPKEREEEAAWAKLHRSKVVLWGLAYVAAAWALPSRVTASLAANVRGAGIVRCAGNNVVRAALAALQQPGEQVHSYRDGWLGRETVVRTSSLVPSQPTRGH